MPKIQLYHVEQIEDGNLGGSDEKEHKYRVRRVDGALIQRIQGYNALINSTAGRDHEKEAIGDLIAKSIAAKKARDWKKAVLLLKAILKHRDNSRADITKIELAHARDMLIRSRHSNSIGK